jgi:hypothetical protein
MTTLAPSEYKTNWDFSGGQTSLGNPMDLGPWRDVVQGRGQKYDDRADASYDWGVKTGDELGVTAKKVTDQALDTSKAFNDWARSDRSFWEGTYKPAMQEQMDFARGYNTDARRQANRGGAMADVGMTFDAAADMSKRALAGYGVNPNSGAFVGLDAGLAAARAKALAGAGTKSDRDTEMLGQQYLANAINTGARLPDQAVNEAGVGMAAGNQAINTGIATSQAQRQLREPSGWAQLGDQQLRDWKEGLVQQTTLGMQQNRDAAEQRMAQAKLDQGSSSGVGAMIGTGLGILGTVVGGMYGGPMGAMAGGALGRMAGGAVGGGGMSNAMGSGTIMNKGGLVPHAADGGTIPEEGEGEPFDWDWQDEGQEVTPEVSASENMVPPEASPSGGAETDDVHAMVSEGEFVVPKDVTAWYGEKYMQGLIEKARKEMAARTAEPEMAPLPPQAMAMSPTFQSEGAMQ